MSHDLCRSCGGRIENWGQASMSGPCRNYWVHLSTRSTDCQPGEDGTTFAFPFIGAQRNEHMNEHQGARPEENTA